MTTVQRKGKQEGTRYHWHNWSQMTFCHTQD